MGIPEVKFTSHISYAVLDVTFLNTDDSILVWLSLDRSGEVCLTDSKTGVGGAGDVRDCTNSNDVDDCLLCTVMRGPTQAVYNQSVKTDIVVTAHLPAAATSEIWTTPSSVWPVLDWRGMVCLQSKAL